MLYGIAAKEAEKLDSNSLEGICRGVAFGRVQNRGTDVVTKDIGMCDSRVHPNLRGRERIVVRKFDGEMHGTISFGREDQACLGSIAILDMEGDVWVGLGLEFGDVLKTTVL